MSMFRETKEFQGISVDQAYQQAEAALEQTGFDTWKKRPLGWLLMADYHHEDGKITGNVSCRPGAVSSVTITLDSDHYADSDLDNLSELFFTAVDSIKPD